jgi:hypothetical protein
MDPREVQPCIDQHTAGKCDPVQRNQPGYSALHEPPEVPCIRHASRVNVTDDVPGKDEEEINPERKARCARLDHRPLPRTVKE